MNHLDPKAVWLFFINIAFVIFIFSFVFLYPIVVILNEVPTNEFLNSLGIYFLLYFVIFLPLGYLYARLSYDNYLYELKDEGFRKESGVIWKRYTTIPYERIQNVDIYRGPIARLFGVSDLQIQTAGQSRPVISEGRLPGLNPQVAEEIRNELVKRAKGIQGV